MRDKADAPGRWWPPVPWKEKVEMLEETGNAVTISGATGKWTKIKWNDKTGWAFGGFLTPNPSRESSDPLHEFDGTWVVHCGTKTSHTAKMANVWKSASEHNEFPVTIYIGIAGRLQNMPVIIVEEITGKNESYQVYYKNLGAVKKDDGLEFKLKAIENGGGEKDSDAFSLHIAYIEPKKKAMVSSSFYIEKDCTILVRQE